MLQEALNSLLYVGIYVYDPLSTATFRPECVCWFHFFHKTYIPYRHMPADLCGRDRSVVSCILCRLYDFPSVFRCHFLDYRTGILYDVMCVFKPRNDEACVDGQSVVLCYILL
jgi:hypothetical protein